jgi:hypothetical protein
MQPRARSRAFAVLVVASLGVGVWACGAASELDREQELGLGGDASPESGPPTDGPYDEGGYQDGYFDGNFEDVYGDDVYRYDGGPDVYDFDVHEYDVYEYDSYYGYDVYYGYDGYYGYDSYYPYDGGYPYDVIEPFDVIFPYDVEPFDSGPPDSGPPWDGGAPVTIATHEEPGVIALDNTYIYWENTSGTVLDCPVAGCPSNVPTLLAVNGEGYSGFESLAVGASTAFFVDSSYNIDSCVGGGCGVAPTLYEGEADAYYYYYESLIADSSNTYFTDGTNVYSCPLGATCSSPLTLYSDVSTSIGPLGVSSSAVFFVREGSFRDSIRSVPLGGGPDTEICRSNILSDVEAMVVTDGYVYFTTGYDPNSIYQCLASGGGTPTVYATDAAPYGLATDGANLYWTNDLGDGTVATCAVGASCTSARTVASDQDYPQSIAVNASSVFWSTSTAIYSAKK